MNVGQALEHANALFFPEFIYAGGVEAMQSEREKNEEAIKVLREAWFEPEGNPGFQFSDVRDLADRNRELCDQIGIDSIESLNGSNLPRALSDVDICKGIGAMQGRAAGQVAKELARAGGSWAVAYASEKISGIVLGIDIETTSRNPDRGYIVNVGWETMELRRGAEPENIVSKFCGIPEMYSEKGVPLEKIHHISWGDVDGKTPFREDSELQENLLDLLTTYPFMAHNAAFEDAWFTLHLNGYAEAKREGKITIIDSRDICRKLDQEVNSALPSSNPASLENWARRRGTLAWDEKERHLSLEDTDLMLRTVIAELSEKNLVM